MGIKKLLIRPEYIIRGGSFFRGSGGGGDLWLVVASLLLNSAESINMKGLGFRKEEIGLLTLAVEGRAVLLLSENTKF